MGSLFSRKTPKIPKPKAKRLPNLSDSSIREAAAKERMRLRNRKGYLSTILSDSLSSGNTLG